jgi:hypothetical protein
MISRPYRTSQHITFRYWCWIRAMLLPVFCDGVWCTGKILSRLPGIFPRRITDPRYKVLGLTSAPAVTVIFDLFDFVLRFVMQVTDDRLRRRNCTKIETLGRFMVIFQVFQVDYRMGLYRIR